MDENAIRIFQELLEKFVETKERFGSNSKAMDEFEQMLKKTFGSLGGFYKQTNKNSEQFAQRLTTLSKEIRRGEASYADQHRLLKQLNNAIEDAKEANADAAEIQKLIDQKKLLAEQAYEQRRKEQWQESGKAIGEAVKAGSVQVANGAGQFVRGLQAGQSGVQITTGLMNAALDVVGASAGGLSKGLTSAGAALFALPNIISKIAGGVIGGAGAILGATQEAAVKLARFGFEILSAEVEKSVKAFNNISSTGAMFARGMDDIRFYSSRAGLTLTEFSDVIKGNAQNLAAAGYTVSEGAKIVANVTSRFPVTLGKSGLSLQREMQNLGYSFKEQADLVTEVITDLRRTGGTATNKQVAEATVEMAKNLRIVADITGEDAKQRMDQVKKEMEQTALDQKLRELARQYNDPSLPGKVRAGLASMEETTRHSVTQALVSGGAVTDALAYISGVAEPAKEIARNIETGAYSIRDMLTPLAKANDKTLAQANDMDKAVSMVSILTGSMTDYAGAIDRKTQQAYKIRSENLDRVIADAEKSQGANEGLQKNVMDAESSAHNLAVSLERDLTPAIEKFSTLSIKMLSIVEDRLAQLGLIERPKTREDTITRSAEETTTQARQNLNQVTQEKQLNWWDKIFDKDYRAANQELISAQEREASVKLAKDMFEGGLQAALKDAVAEENIKKHGFFGRIVERDVELSAEQKAAIEQKYRKEFVQSSPMITDTTGRRTSAASLLDMPKMARGGVTSGLTLAGEAGPEAVVPLPDGKTIPVQLTMSMEKELLSGIGSIPAQLIMKMEKELLSGLGGFDMGTTHNLGAQKTNALGSLQDIRNLKIEDFSKQVHDLVEKFKQGTAVSQAATSESATSSVVDGTKEMVDLMQRQLAAMQEQTNLTRSMINEQQRGNRVSRDILTASY